MRIDFIIELFSRIDDKMKNELKHSQATLYPSELVTLGHALRLVVMGIC